MAAFDFITEEEFRASLEADYRELGLCMEAGAWKAACVLAGSIVEAVLVDYLIALDHRKQDPLKMNLGQVIDSCQEEGILSDKTVGLTSAIRLYRNLIHPGRAKRLGETINENAARVAQPLVEIIVDEVSSHKARTYGLTAEQIVAKLERDPSAASIVGLLLKDAKPLEIERLLTSVMPQRYFRLMEADLAQVKPILRSLEKSFRSAFQMALYDVKMKVAKEFVTILKEETELRVVAYGTAFFKGKDLEYLVGEDRQLAKEHLLSRLDEEALRPGLLQVLEGLGQFLSVEDVARFADPIIMSVLIRGKADLETEKWILATLERLESEARRMNAEVRTQLETNLGGWITYFEQKDERTPTEDRLIEEISYLQAAVQTLAPR